jgi:hypothetical protein
MTRGLHIRPSTRKLGLLHAAAGLALLGLLAGCSHVGRLQPLPQTIAPADTTGGHQPGAAVRRASSAPYHPMFGADTLIGFVPGTGDSARRFLGRLRSGFTADTLNLILLGDNRPGFRSTRLNKEIAVIKQGFSPNPVKIVHGLVTIPIALVKGMVPDLALVRDIPPMVTGSPKWGREHQVLHAVMTKMDTLKAHDQVVAAAINTGDLVYDGRNPAHWERFMRIWQPLSARVPYFAVAGNHEKTWTEDGLANWRTATGLPIGGDRLYYCFDSADGWVRFIALDSNPITMPGVHWSKDVQIKYSKEQVDWLTARLKEHHGPSFVFMHSPPYSAGYHRMDWEMDDVMRARRDQIVTAMHEGGISVLIGGHEHDYERALLTWPDGQVLIAMVQGGAGAPLHQLQPPAKSAAIIASSQTPKGVKIDPKNVYTAMINNFTLLRLWFGGGEIQTFAVEKDGSVKLADQVNIDLKRYGKPKIDQYKVVVQPTARVQTSGMEARAKAGVPEKADTTAASKRLETSRAPGKKKPGLKPASAPKSSTTKKTTSGTHSHAQ